jgi:hypothetical protein
MLAGGRPLWVKSEQTIAGQNPPLSALVHGRSWFVRFVPKADIARLI